MRGCGVGCRRTSPETVAAPTDSFRRERGTVTLIGNLGAGSDPAAAESGLAADYGLQGSAASAGDTSRSDRTHFDQGDRGDSDDYGG